MPKDDATKADAKAVRKAIQLEKDLAELRKAKAEALLEEIRLEEYTIDLEDQKRKTADEAATNARRGVFYFNTGVSSLSVTVCREFLNRWASTNPGEPIEIVFNSGGGSVFDGLDLGDAIEHMISKGHHVTTVIAGYACSMAGILVQFGSTRVIGRNSWLHQHEVSSGALGKTSDLEDAAALAKRLTMQACEIYARRSGKNADDIHKAMERHEVWFSAEEALAAGYVDEIR